MYYIFAFKSRTSAMNFYNALRMNRISSIVINTPPSAQIGCGLSIKLSPLSLREAKEVFTRGNYPSFLGVFKVSIMHGRWVVERQ